MRKISSAEPAAQDLVSIAGATDRDTEGGAVNVQPWLGLVASQLDVGTRFSKCATHVPCQKLRNCTLTVEQFQKHVPDHCVQTVVFETHLLP